MYIKYPNTVTYNPTIDIIYLIFQVTILTPFKASRKHKNIKSIVFEDNDIKPMMVNPFEGGMLAATLNAMEKGPAMCFKALSSVKTKSVLLKKYDLVFVSVFFNECFLGAVHSFGVSNGNLQKII